MINEQQEGLTSRCTVRKEGGGGCGVKGAWMQTRAHEFVVLSCEFVHIAVLLLSQTFVFSARKNRVCFTFLLSSQTVNCMWRMLHLVLAGPAQTVAPE